MKWNEWIGEKGKKENKFVWMNWVKGKKKEHKKFVWMNGNEWIWQKAK
jgi:hypothetical protein